MSVNDEGPLQQPAEKTHDEAVDEGAVERRSRAYVAQQRRRQHATWLCMHLPSDEDCDPKHASDDGSQGCRRRPGILRATPRDTDEETGRASYKQ